MRPPRRPGLVVREATGRADLSTRSVIRASLPATTTAVCEQSKTAPLRSTHVSLQPRRCRGIPRKKELCVVQDDLRHTARPRQPGNSSPHINLDKALRVVIRQCYRDEDWEKPNKDQACDVLSRETFFENERVGRLSDPDRQQRRDKQLDSKRPVPEAVPPRTPRLITHDDHEDS
jgi:hypothetical protein